MFYLLCNWVDEKIELERRILMSLVLCFVLDVEESESITINLILAGKIYFEEQNMCFSFLVG